MDLEYRKILRCLTKSAKDYQIKELSMNPNPVERRERFRMWVVDLKNILSTHSKTSGLLDDYPVHVNIFKDNVDKAVKALLSSVTTGMAKRIVSNANSAHNALLDLKRN